jgi:hypothetical protein
MTDAHDPLETLDPLDPLDPLDDIASAVLDGIATPEETARARTDPQVAARVGELRASRDALRASLDAVVGDEVDGAQREQAIAAALAAYDDESTLAHRSQEALPPVTLARRRVGMAAPRTWLIGIAAAVALLALAVPLLGGLSGNSDDDDSSDQVAAEVFQSSDDDAAGSAREGSADDQATSEAGAESSTLAAPADLGPFDDLEALASEAATRASEAEREPPSATSAPVTTIPPGGVDTSQSLAAPACPAVADAAYVARAELDGRPVLVLVGSEVNPDGTRRVEILDAADCSVVGTTASPPRQP